VRDYVSLASARDEYGVVLTGDLDIDATATARLRKEKPGS
jgi:hypothetical protein